MTNVQIVARVEGLAFDSVIGRQYAGPDGDETPVTLADACVAEVVRQLAVTPEWGSLRDRIRDLRAEAVREIVTAEVVAALSQPVQRTNTYGEPVGSPFTLREEIARLAAEALSPNTRGRAAGPETPLQLLIRDQVDIVLKRELASALDAEKAKIIAAVRAKGAELLTAAVAQGLGLRV